MSADPSFRECERVTTEGVPIQVQPLAGCGDGAREDRLLGVLGMLVVLAILGFNLYFVSKYLL
jgi:hypothetical protein